MNNSEISEQGKLTIVGTGPGTDQLLAPAAKQALLEADSVIGYKTYVDLIRHILPESCDIQAYGMRQEVERSRAAAALALEGKKVCIVSGGDAGVFSIAGPVLEVISEEDLEKLNLSIIPGITSALSSAALLGAPLIHDFAVISLSDLLTPTELIEKRLSLAAEGDFVVVLYNPASKKRTELIKKCAQIMIEAGRKDTPVGIVRHGFRADQNVTVTTVSEMLNHDIDMNTTVVIGNSRTYRKGRFMVTPRGYAL
ncbi:MULTISPECIES: precorrin-3B C(17)-methyltransferase [unclassified Oceanispirochaeta]|uniref:precorrin-3B C(17)-methyltransferase n=1 Tax=unclassified Oceanispirochaeta TaxID=2635722 RepID=UPI000E099192|nr:MULTISPECIES: precorrin-3B C(17)-methyltransferase [unclassified Oceanispirochaeta]MBF9014813.1 precorrin-3B C(17)-methyltransferase [Oceanispirochaeta sp. M2]NPD71069.1 precorrin-3B C(17)-methyltransferase [Oceanispirochaeta sp. M1]RDG33902.1 precorrin-3B C(17)-methyltransferase [Oceanispirochaeta sp. M1]